MLGHLYKLARASGVTAVLDSAAVPLIDGALAALQAGYIPGGSRRNLDWVAPRSDFGRLSLEQLLLLPATVGVASSSSCSELSRRNLDWVAPRSDFGGLSSEQLLLLADAQTSGGLLVAGEIPGAPIVGELIPSAGPVLILR